MAWKSRECFMYVATGSLPLRAYVATGSIGSGSGNTAEMTWRPHIDSKKMSEKQFPEFLAFMLQFVVDASELCKSEKQFPEFLAFMGSFYEASLESLKVLLEKKAGRVKV